MNSDHVSQTTDVALALGSNVGDRFAALRSITGALQPYVTVRAVSPVYETRPVYVTDQSLYLNAALIGTTHLSPMALLWNLKQLETELGRKPTFRYGPRYVDIDIIFYGDLVVSESELKIPHPRLSEREFVLKPLADVAPSWRHPQSGLTVAEMLKVVASSDPACLGPL